MLTPLWMQVKGVTAEASKDAGGDKVCAAVSARIRRTAAFSDYSNVDVFNRIVPFDAALEVDQHNMKNGKPPRHTDFAARQLGFMLVRRPTGAVAGGDVTALCKISTESAEAVAAFGAARADGVTTPEEASFVRQKIADAQTAFAELDARLALLEQGVSK